MSGVPVGEGGVDRVEGCRGGGAEEAMAALVVTSGDRPALLQAVDRPFDGVALLVSLSTT
ncbi:hypothetical protein [Streptomyces tendae]|uniref:hypothetical protein n=1 Tax=Streptomyces tendae TaxID=1932 RepID=UPI00381F576D